MKIDHLPENWRYEKREQSYAVWDENGVMRCGTKLRNGKRKGMACINYPEKGRLRCNLHQGEKRMGPENPSYKTGEHSRYYRSLPPRLKSRYTEMLESGDLANLSENVAILDVLLSEQLGRLDIGQFGASYNALRSLHYRAQAQFQGANNQAATQDERRASFNEFMETFREMGELIATGQRDYVTLQNVLSLNAERRQTVKTMSDIEHKGENAIPVAQMMAVFFQLENLFVRVNRLEASEDRAREMAIGMQKIVNFQAG